VATERTSSAGWASQLQLRRGLPLRSQRVRGDAAALAALYERHHQALYRYCLSILRDEDDARDALQSTMTNALSALRDEQRDFELRPWLFRIAHNEAISRVRRRREIADPDAMAAASIDSLAQTVEDRERLAHLHTDLQDLPERQRAALVLRELSGLSHDEIAGVLDCTARAVKQTIFEARVALQECAEGRAMECVNVQRALSDGDGRVLRGRKMRAHVRSCRSCRQFKAALAQRPADLAALAPTLPAGAGSALLAHLLSGAKAGLASGAGTATGLGGGVAGTVATKAAIVAVATVTLAGTTTAVRSAVEPSHDPAAAPSRAAPAPPPRTAPASVVTPHQTPAQRRRPVPATQHARTSATGHGASAGKAKGKAKHAAAHSARPSHAAQHGGRGKSQVAQGHSKPTKLKGVKPVKPAKAVKPAKTRPTHPVHPSAAGKPAGAASSPSASVHGAAAAPAAPAAPAVTPPDHGASSAAPAGKQQATEHTS
jgi:RNA polymerase sigma factor (sigma-70 family)